MSGAASVRPVADGRQRRRPIRSVGVIAVVLAAVTLLASCSSTRNDPRLDWTPDASCPAATTVGASSGLSTLRFAVDTAAAETLRNSGCSYRDSATGIRIDAAIVPGPPGDVQFGSAAGVVDTKRPALGTGAHLGTSPAYCSVAVPKAHSGTIQIDVTAATGARKDVAHACLSILSLLKEFAQQRGK